MSEIAIKDGQKNELEKTMRPENWMYLIVGAVAAVAIGSAIYLDSGSDVPDFANRPSVITVPQPV